MLPQNMLGKAGRTLSNRRQLASLVTDVLGHGLASPLQYLLFLSVEPIGAKSCIPPADATLPKAEDSGAQDEFVAFTEEALLLTSLLTVSSVMETHMDISFPFFLHQHGYVHHP